MIQLKDITKDFGTKTVLDSVCETIYDGEKIGIIGDNGQGKSTLLQILTKQLNPDSGTVVFDDNLAFLPQSSDFGFEKLFEFLADKSFANEFFVWLKKFGFLADFEKCDFKKISCGEKTKIALAFCFSQKPTTLILDEPTNHLDLEAKQLLIKNLNDFWGTVVVVSHDKDFLNQTVQKIWELKDGKIFEYYGNYDDFKQQKQQKQLEIKRNYEKHKKEIQDIERQIDMYKRALEKSDKKTHHGAKRRTCNTTTQDERAKSLSKFAANRITKLKQGLQKDVVRPEKETKIRYNLKKEDLKSKYAIIAKDLKKSFNGRTLFENLSFQLESGDKLAIVGNNGAGKTTLVNMILGKTDFEGELRLTPSLKIALMSQDVYDLDGEQTINDMSKLKDKTFRTDFITNLCSMNLDKSRFDTKIKFLSSGEKMRIKLCEIILSDANMIILDEPTNHLDILNKDYLELVLKNFEGTLVVISHDKDFVKNVCNKTLKLANK